MKHENFEFLKKKKLKNSDCFYEKFSISKKYFQILKIDFRHEKIIFFFRIFFPGKVSTDTGEKIPPPGENSPLVMFRSGTRGGIFSQAENFKFGIARKQLILIAKTLSRGLKPKKNRLRHLLCKVKSSLQLPETAKFSPAAPIVPGKIYFAAP